jgi:hypothetical protein
VLYKKGALLILRNHLGSPPVIRWSPCCLCLLFSVFVLCVCVFYVQHCPCLWIVYSWLPFWFTLMFIYTIEYIPVRVMLFIMFNTNCKLNVIQKLSNHSGINTQPMVIVTIPYWIQGFIITVFLKRLKI